MDNQLISQIKLANPWLEDPSRENIQGFRLTFKRGSLAQQVEVLP